MDVETVSEIFVRIDSRGVALFAADFAMSKMAANERFSGYPLRKCIDYFCHLAIRPEAYAIWQATGNSPRLSIFRSWKRVKHEQEDLYPLLHRHASRGLHVGVPSRAPRVNLFCLTPRSSFSSSAAK